MQAARGAPLTDDRPRRRLGLVLSIAAVVVAVDASTKALAVDRLDGRDPVEVIDGVLELTLTRNAGAAFGVGVGATVVFSVVALAVVAVLVRIAARLRSVPWAVALALLLGGATGNLADRLFREPGPLRGHVVDWIRLPHWPVFNVADTCIVIGAILAVLVSLRGHGIDGSGPADPADRPAGPDDPGTGHPARDT